MVVLGLGSNVGDRLANLAAGVKRLVQRGISLEKVSSVCETPPLGYPDQPWFLNLVLAGGFLLEPDDLLLSCREAEEAAGRKRPFPNAPRTLDVDVLFFGSRIVRRPDLRVPHPRWKDRSFVVRPLAEILPGLRDPETGLSVEEVARSWPLKPEPVHLMLPGNAFLQLVDKGA